MANKSGDLKIWWVPQMPCKAFEWPVSDVRQASMMLDMLGSYDQFQLDNRIKPDYCNAGGLLVFENGEWSDWYDENGDDIDSIRRELADVPS